MPAVPSTHTAPMATTPTLEQLATKHWQRWADLQRAAWDEPLHAAALRMGVDVALLEETLDEARIRPRWNRAQEKDHLAKCVDLTLSILGHLLREKQTLAHRTVVLPAWDGWSVPSNLATLVAILEEALQLRVTQAGCGARRPADKQPVHFINFGDPL